MISTSGGDFDSADGRPSKEEEVVRRVLYSPNTVPSSDELKIVLNSLKHLYDSGTKSETFMERCRKQKVLDGFRAMEEDHPLQNLNLADVEKLFTEHPKIMEALTNVSVSAFNFPSVPSIGIEGLQVVAPEVKTYFTWAAAVAASVIAMKEMGIMDVETFLASCLGAFSTAYILDRPPFLNGLISRSAGWLRAIIDFSIPQKKEVVHRQTAAAFLVAYFTGTPILSINMDPRDSQVRRRSIYADALKIETVDPTMGVLEGKGKISLRALQRTIAMQTASIAVDIMDGRDTDVTPYLRILMAALFERANTLQYSALQVYDFSTFILPTLLRWGILEALLILKESSECYKAVLDVVQRGGDVGDAVLALEAALTSDHPLYKRQEMRLQEQAAASAIAPAAQSLTPFVELIIKARQVPDSTFVEDDAPHELIKGTDRYTWLP